jgi:hypothetical protein
MLIGELAVWETEMVPWPACFVFGYRTVGWLRWPKEISEAKPRAAMIALRFIVFLLNTQRREGLYRYFYAWCR